LTVAGSPIGVEIFDHALDISHSRAGGVGIAAIGDHLDLCGFAGEQVSLEVLADLDDEEHAAAVDPSRNIFGPVEIGLAPKDAGSIQAGEKCRRGSTMVLVNDGIGDGVEVKAGGVTKN
jgi:hypothetical protein